MPAAVIETMAALADLEAPVQRVRARAHGKQVHLPAHRAMAGDEFVQRQARRTVDDLRLGEVKAQRKVWRVTLQVRDQAPDREEAERTVDSVDAVIGRAAVMDGDGIVGEGGAVGIHTDE